MIIQGDCLEVMPTLEAESVDAVVTDPPAGIHFMSKSWDHNKGGRAQWVGWMTAVMSECYRLLKPGGWLVCWSLPRTSHWTAWAIEDAGFRITDCLMHVFASGFPKGRSQLKPAYEPWVLARKPGPLRELAIDACRIGTGGEEWSGGPTRDLGGVTYGGALNEARSDSHPLGRWPSNVVLTDPIFDGGWDGVVGGGWTESGSGVAGTGSGDERGIFGMGSVLSQTYGDSGTYSRFFLIPKSARSEREPIWEAAQGLDKRLKAGYSGGDRDGELTGLDARLRTKTERANVHPTVKPLELMRHLVRLVTPTDGLVLDPFLGSGTTGIAAEMEGFRWLGIEREESYVRIAEARLHGTQKGLGLDVPAPTTPWKDYPTATRYPVKGPSQSSWFTDSTRGGDEEVPA